MRRLMHRRFKECPRIQPHQIAVAGLARRQQHDPRRTRGQRVAGIGVLVAEIDRQLAADDRLDAVTGHLVGKFQRPNMLSVSVSASAGCRSALASSASFWILIDPFSSE